MICICEKEAEDRFRISIMWAAKNMFNNIYKRDMSEIVGNFFKTSHSVIANFSMCDSLTLNNLSSTFCSSPHWVELFNLTKSYMLDHRFVLFMFIIFLFIFIFFIPYIFILLYRSLEKVIRRLFRIPARIHNSVVLKFGGCFNMKTWLQISLSYLTL